MDILNGLKEILSTPARCLPVNCGCEHIDTNAFLAQPVNTLTSALFFGFALMLYYQVRPRTPQLAAWVMVMSLVGVGSLVAHATFLEIAMAADFAGIAMVMLFFSGLRLQDRLGLSRWALGTGSVLVYFIFLVLFFQLDKTLKIALCTVLAGLMVWEVRAGLTIRSDQKSLRTFGLAVLAGAMGLAFFVIDETKVQCDPHGFFHGHTFWHLGTASAMYFLGKWRMS